MTPPAALNAVKSIKQDTGWGMGVREGHWMVIEAFSEAAMFKLGREYEEKAAVETAFQVQGAASTKGLKRESRGLPKDRERARGV